MEWLRTEAVAEKLPAPLFYSTRKQRNLNVNDPQDFCLVPPGAGNPQCKVAIVMCRSGIRDEKIRSAEQLCEIYVHVSLWEQTRKYLFLPFFQSFLMSCFSPSFGFM